MILKRLTVLLAGTALLGLGACNQGQPADLVDTVQQMDANFMTYYNDGDAASLGLLYADDAIAMPPNGPAVSGKDNLIGFWEVAMASGMASLDLTTDEVKGAGDFAFDRGSYVAKDKDGNVIDTGKYLVVCKKVGGVWKMYRDIWNSNEALPEAAPAEDMSGDNADSMN